DRHPPRAAALRRSAGRPRRAHGALQDHHRHPPRRRRGDDRPRDVRHGDGPRRGSRHAQSRPTGRVGARGAPGERARRESRRQLGSYDVRDFAAYYVSLSLVTNLAMSWNAYDFEFEVRMGRLSPKLLRPLHPIHYAVVENIVWKMTTIIPLLIVLGFVAVTFD